MKLYGWKAIAEYLGISVRSAQRWERNHDLPVKRRFGRVWQSSNELDKWALNAHNLSSK